jgi:NAD(P)-dependent dehydrogenase (short-subunit alcohol dehydrogenase family)
MKLNGKTAVITGGASGIGRAIGQQFAEEGAAIAIIDANGDKAAAAVAELSAQGHTAWCAIADVRDEASINAAVASILARGNIDILVNSAGIGVLARFLETTAELFDTVHAINMRGTFLVAQAVARSMVERKVAGSIINIGSASGIRGNAGRTAYGVGKAGIGMLTKIMAVELATHGIRTNAIAPGPIETPLATGAHSSAARDSWLNELPIRRYGTPGEVARVALFLACDDSSYVTGHILSVDGGFAASGILQHGS